MALDKLGTLSVAFNLFIIQHDYVIVNQKLHC